MRTVTGFAAIICLVLASTAQSRACPFCSATQPTLSEEIDGADVAVIATMLPRAKQDSKDESEKLDIFRIETVLKGKELLGAKRQIALPALLDVPKTTHFFITKREDSEWARPLAITARAANYITVLPSLPANGMERIKFVQEYLEDEDSMLAMDAYDEFARADYDAVKKLKPHMHHDQLVKWIQDPEVLSSRRRLYLTMLGVCGTDTDIPMLEKMIVGKDTQVKLIMDALIACYLTLKGGEGVPLIEKRFLIDPETSYSQAYSAILAIRFHLQTGEAVPKERLLQALRHVLARKDLAHVVIADLARMQDWSVLGDLVKIFNDTDDDTWVRVPVINYMKACPLPEAKKQLSEMAKIDPEAMRRANLFPAFVRGARSKTASSDKDKDNDSSNGSPGRSVKGEK